jgi:hypothetical protein
MVMYVYPNVKDEVCRIVFMYVFMILLILHLLIFTKTMKYLLRD